MNVLEYLIIAESEGRSIDREPHVSQISDLIDADGSYSGVDGVLKLQVWNSSCYTSCC